MTDADPLPHFGANLRAAREKNGLSQEAFAQRVGMDPAEIRRLESARRAPARIRSNAASASSVR